MRKTHDILTTFVLTSGNKIMMDECEEHTTVEIAESPSHPQQGTRVIQLRPHEG